MTGKEQLYLAKEMILSSKKAAAEHIANIQNAPEPDRDLVQREVRAYIMAKFHLTEEDCTTDNFSQLAEISLSKSMKISRELVKMYDLARSCDGVSSHTAKMVLLFMALQKDLKIRFQPMETAEAETLEDIGDLVWKEIKKKNRLEEDI